MVNLGRVPRLIAPLNAYINNTTEYLTAPSSVDNRPNWQRLGLLPTELQTWQNLREQWNALYEKYSDKAGSRTIVITAKIHELQKKFTDFSSRILMRIPGMPEVNNDDAAIFNFILKRKDPSKHKSPVEEIPMFGQNPLGGGAVKFQVYPNNTDSRAKKLPGTEIEIRYHIQPTEEKPPLVDALTQHRISSKAIFILNTDSPGKMLYVSIRWIYIKHPERNGPWSGVQRVAVA
jgi:hypothetical protein